MRKRLFPLLFLLLSWANGSYAQYVWEDVERVVAVGDVHGAYDALVDLLESADLIDANGDWTGGATHLVSLGDLLDRGPASNEVLRLVMSMQKMGTALVVCGNHKFNGYVMVC